MCPTRGGYMRAKQKIKLRLLHTHENGKMKEFYKLDFYSVAEQRRQTTNHIIKDDWCVRAYATRNTYAFSLNIYYRIFFIQIGTDGSIYSKIYKISKSLRSYLY